MQRNARGTYERDCKLPGECREMPGERTVVGTKCQGNVGNAGECQGNVSECKVPGECRGMTGESTGVGVKC